MLKYLVFSLLLNTSAVVLADDGTVKWWDPQAGMGAINPADGSDDVFAHYSVIEIPEKGSAVPRPGQSVAFTAINRQATWVRLKN